MKRAAGRTGALQPLPPFTGPGLPEGVGALGLDPARDGLVRCPPDVGALVPLFVLLHGAGGTAEQGLALGARRPEAAGAVLLAPQSRAATWDMMAGGWGPDVRFLDRAMGHVAARVRIDPSHIILGGFSDGASYALSLGLANGGLFGAILAFSPGFVAPPNVEGRPRVYVSHGTQDQVLPIGRCSRRLVPQLQGAGYDVRYHEFPGGHVVPGEIAGEAFAWALPGGGITGMEG
jgi:phospholipase/carboxylesterase